MLLNLPSSNVASSVHQELCFTGFPRTGKKVAPCADDCPRQDHPLNRSVQDSPVRMPQLDSLRALAFFGVAASHWLKAEIPFATVGGTGVQLFFVLSGFLITGILLDYRRTVDGTSGVRARSALKTFYARRVLRIFPLFFGVIAVTALLNVGPIRELWPWHVFFGSNFLYAMNPPGAGDPFTHFWSLAVEEQFYLVWPALVLLLPLVALRRVILILIVLGPVFRIVMEQAFPEMHRVNYLPLSCGDALGVGALLGLTSRGETHFRISGAHLARNLGVIGIAGGIGMTCLLLTLGNHFWIETIGHTFLVLAFGWLVFRAANGFGGPIGTVLNLRPLRYLGAISYGLYVIHNFFTNTDFRNVCRSVGMPQEWGDNTIVKNVLRTIFTLLLAMASWHLYEKPLNGLKRYFAPPSQGRKGKKSPGRGAFTSSEASAHDL